MNRARIFIAVSAFLLAISIVAVFMSTQPQWSGDVAYLMWIHLAVILVFLLAVRDLRRLRASHPPTRTMTLSLLLRPWLVVAGLIALASAAPDWTGTSLSDRGTNANGHPITSQSWHSTDGRYFLRNDSDPEHEISRQEYGRLSSGLYGLFARMWVVFSFLCLCMWHFIIVRQRAVAAGLSTTNSSTPPPSTPYARHPPSVASTLLILAIWALAIGGNALQFLRAEEWRICQSGFPAEMLPVLLLMPLVFFGFVAFRAKHSPFAAPLVSELVDAKFGAFAYDRFLVRLKPLLLFGVCGLFGGVLMASQCWSGNSDLSRESIPLFLASGGVALLLAHEVMRRRGVPGV